MLSIDGGDGRVAKGRGWGIGQGQDRRFFVVGGGDIRGGRIYIYSRGEA